MESNTTIADIAKTLKLRKATQKTTALFLGAKAGGLFRSSRLYDLLRSVGPNDLYNLPPLERYRECYHILCDPKYSLQDINHVLADKELVKQITIELPELCVAELMKQNIFNPILSVSVYGEFEEAFRQMGMKETLNFDVAWPRSGSSMPRIHTEQTDRFALIKVFGDIASRDYNINKRVKHLDENEGLKNLMHDLRDRNILVVGVDQSWDQHILSSLFQCSGDGSVWYVNDEEPARDSLLSDYLKQCEADLLLGVDGLYGNFFKSLCEHITGATPTYQAAVEKVMKELEENQNIIRRLTDEVGGLREEIRSLQSELRQFFSSSPPPKRTRKIRISTKTVEEK